MGGEWQRFTLGELCSLITDGKHGDCENEDGSGYYFLSVKDVFDNRLVYDNARQITEHDFLDTHRRTDLSPGDILFTNTGTIGRMAIAPEDPKTARTTFQKSVAILKPSRNLVEPKFLYYALKFENARLSEFAAGTTQKNLLLKDFRRFEVGIPDLSTQRAIAHILGTLDDKIELNRRMNETLEAIARALFKSWFVDFDPVRAKAEGRDTGLPKHIADLFPDSFEDSELGEVPKGWGVNEFGDIAEHLRRTVHPEGLDPATPYIALEHMPKRSISLAEWGIADELQSNKFEFKKGELLFGKLRPYFHKVGVAPIDGVCSTDIVVVRPTTVDWFGFALGHISSDSFVEYTNACSTGTKMPRTNWTDMAHYPVVLPPSAIGNAFTELMTPLVDQIVATVHERRTLAALRDTLLLKLIAGELQSPLSGTDYENQEH